MFPRPLTSMALAAAALIGTTAAYAQASPSDLKLSFRDPTGTVQSTDSIEVWVTLTNSNLTDAFSFDLTIGEPWGFSPGDLPTQAYSPEASEFVTFDAYTFAGNFTSRTCSDDSFVDAGPSGCGGGPYTTSVPPSPNWFDNQVFTLAAGTSIDINLSILNPVGGDAPAGVYSLSFMGLGVSVTGDGTDSNLIVRQNLSADIFSVGTCDGQLAANCAFTRTVVSAVPEPATWMAMLGGLGVLGASVKRSRRFG